MAATLIATLIIYFLVRFYLPIDKIVSAICKKKEKEEIKEEDTTVELESQTEEVSKEEVVTNGNNKFTINIMACILTAIIVSIPFLLTMIFTDKWAHGLIIFGVMLGLSLIANILESIIVNKTNKTYALILEFVLFIFAFVIFENKIGFKNNLNDYVEILNLALVLIVMIKPFGLLVKYLEEDILNIDEKIFSLDGVIGIFIRIIVVIMINQNLLTIPFLLAVIVLIKYKDLLEKESRNKLVLDLIANFGIGLIVTLLLTIL